MWFLRGGIHIRPLARVFHLNIDSSTRSAQRTPEKLREQFGMIENIAKSLARAVSLWCAFSESNTDTYRPDVKYFDRLYRDFQNQHNRFRETNLDMDSPDHVSINSPIPADFRADDYPAVINEELGD